MDAGTFFIFLTTEFDPKIWYYVSGSLSIIFRED
ncbi:hypothetical protein EV294_10981 [Paenibacillus sp. BK033]|nr:hypothetical protein EV294_10981 [Paenibacillus sp. BK033]